jgi:iron complex outermembrane receptor protein
MGCAAGAVLCSAPQALAREGATQPALIIDAQPLGAALTELAQKTGVNILFSSEAVRGLRSNPINAQIEPENAARLLVAGTALDVKRDPTGALIIRKRFRDLQPAAATLAANDVPSGRAPEAAAVDTAPAAPPQTQLNEVIVTAQRRSERLKDVPISVTAVSGQTLTAAGVKEVRDLATVTPGLLVERIGSNVNPIIRGIGSSITAPGVDTNVAIYLDGVVQPIPSNNAIELNNIERVEVLKGPQGTLFGRNATGGAISIITRTPSFTPHFEADVGYGSHNEVRSDLYVTGGLGDKLAADTAIMFREDDGYIRNINTGNELGRARSFSARSKLLFKPTDNFTVVGSYAHTYRFDNQAVTYHVLDGITAARQVDPTTVTNLPHDQVSLTVDPYVRTTSDQYAVNATWTAGSTKINAITSFSRYTSYVLSDQDSTAVNYQLVKLWTKDDIFTEDINATSHVNDVLDLLAGLSYYHGRTTNYLFVYGGSLTVPSYILNSFNRTTSLAGFGELTFHINPALTLITGLRYTTEKPDSSAFSNFGQVLQLSTRFSGWSPRASLRYALSPETNLYVTYSRGFKSGLIDIGNFNHNPVKPEINDAIEGGVKYSSGMLSFSVAAYHYWYNNIQVESFANSFGLPTVQNAASARIYGVEADAAVALTDQLKINGGLAYNHARFASFLDAPVFTPLAAGGNALSTVDLSGTKLPRAPDFTANGTIAYRQPIGGDALEASLTGLYNGGFSWDPANTINQHAYGVLNGRLDWTTASGRLKLSLWAENITDTRYSQQTNESTVATLVLYNQPRQVGVTVGTKF